MALMLKYICYKYKCTYSFMLQKSLHCVATVTHQ